MNESVVTLQKASGALKDYDDDPGVPEGSRAAVTHRVDDDFAFCDFTKDKVWIGQCCQTANGGVVGANADMGVIGQELDNVSDARLDALRALRRVLGDVVED